MSKSSITISKADSTIALDYLVRHLADSRFVQYLGRDVLTAECGNISILTDIFDGEGYMEWNRRQLSGEGGGSHKY